ncbi:cytochrome P450 [Streptomyces sp. NPDC051569]|uniref:cytochrome P450 n=1 Tax=Streptomyces sp. NPDC051569 TaxID=3365661 RepID=UPI0037B5F3DF
MPHLTFDPKIEQLLREHVGTEAFRVDPRTVGIADGALLREAMSRRTIHDFESSVFRPVERTRVDPETRKQVMRALAQDIRAATAADSAAWTSDPEHLLGIWPRAGSRHLARLLFRHDPWFLRMLVRTPNSRTAMGLAKAALTKAVPTGSVPSRAGGDMAESALSRLLMDPEAPHRSIALRLYRRTANALCSAVAALLTNAVYLESERPSGARTRDIFLETLRLLPPSWLLSRQAGREYADLHPLIGPGDGLLLCPLLAHRNPLTWDEPSVYAPARWSAVTDPESLTDFVPFGSGTDRCWARSQVVQLAEYAWERGVGRLAVNPSQRVARVEVRPILTVARLDVNHVREARSPAVR